MHFSHCEYSFLIGPPTVQPTLPINKNSPADPASAVAAAAATDKHLTHLSGAPLMNSVSGPLACGILCIDRDHFLAESKGRSRTWVTGVARGRVIRLPNTRGLKNTRFKLHVLYLGKGNQNIKCLSPPVPRFRVLGCLDNNYNNYNVGMSMGGGGGSSLLL